MANANGCDNLQKDRIPVRKGPSSPVNPYATLSEHEAREHQMRESKPPYSYANLITFSINSSESKKMTLSEIYQWICDNFPYYREAGSGWKVRRPRRAICMSHKNVRVFNVIVFERETTTTNVVVSKQFIAPGAVCFRSQPSGDKTRRNLNFV